MAAIRPKTVLDKLSGRGSLVMNWRSQDRLNYATTTASNCVFNPSATIQCTGISLVDFQLENLIYNVDSASVVFTENGVVRTGTLANGRGFYTAQQLIDAVQTAMNAVATGALQAYTVTLNPNSMKVTVATAGALTFQLGSATTGINWHTGPWFQLGWPITAAAAYGTAALTFTGPNVVDMIQPSTIYLRCPGLFTSASFNPLGAQGTGLQLPIVGTYGEVLTYDWIANPLYFDYPGRLSTLNFTITDEEGDEVDLNGGDWTATIFIHRALTSDV